MFIIILSYLKPISEIDALLEPHVKFLNDYYASGVFLASGRKVPRTGGVILAKAESREEIERIVAEDPFAVHGVASYEIIEFTASKAAPGLEGLLNL